MDRAGREKKQVQGHTMAFRTISASRQELCEAPELAV